MGGADMDWTATALAAAAVQVEALAKTVADSDGIEDPAALLDLVKDASRRLLAVQLDLEGLIWQRAGRGVHDAGRAPVQVDRGAPSKRWDSEGLLGELVARSRVDGDGQQLPDGEAFLACVETLRQALPLNQSLGWRTKALRALGIDPDEWHAKGSPGRVKVERLPVRPDTSGDENEENQDKRDGMER